MNDEETIRLINTLKFVETDGDGEIINYVLVEDNESTKSVLEKLNADDFVGGDETYIDTYKTNGMIDISPLAFEYAEWFDGDEFLLLHPQN